MARLGGPEAEVQSALVKRLRTELPGAVVSSTPNEVHRRGVDGMKEVVRKKAIGMLPGFPDLTVVWWGHVYFIEVKAKGGSMQQSQKECHERLHRAGFRVIIVKGEEQIEDAMAKIKACGKERWKEGFPEKDLSFEDEVPF